MTTKEELFLPNNHSAYRISYAPVSGSRTHALAAFVREHFAAHDVDEDAIAQVVESEQASNNFRINMRLAGREAETYLLRKHILIERERDVVFLEKTLGFLNDANVSAPVLIPAVNGEHHVVHDGALWQLFEFIPGNHYRGTEAELAAAGKSVGMLHKALAPFPFGDALERKTPALDPLSSNALTRVLDAARKHNASELDTLFITHGQFLAEICRGTLEMFERAGSVPKQAIHGDLHPHNTLCPSEDRCILVDFDMMRFGERVRDVAFALHRFVRQYVVERRGDIGSVVAGTRIFLDAYETENQLEPEEKQSLQAFMRHELLSRIVTDFSRFYFEGGTRYATAEELEKKIMLLKETAFFHS